MLYTFVSTAASYLHPSQPTRPNGMAYNIHEMETLRTSSVPEMSIYPPSTHLPPYPPPLILTHNQHPNPNHKQNAKTQPQHPQNSQTCPSPPLPLSFPHNVDTLTPYYRNPTNHVNTAAETTGIQTAPTHYLEGKRIIVLSMTRRGS